MEVGNLPVAVASRFIVEERPSQHPASCRVCGAIDRPVVSFGVDIETEDQGYGKLYMCVTCIKEAYTLTHSPEADDHVCTDDAALEMIRDDVTRYLDSSLDAWRYSTRRIVPDDGVSSKDNAGREPRAGEVARETDKSVVDKRSAGVSSSNDHGSVFIDGIDL